MAWFCNGCAERRRGVTCKKECRKKYGDMGAEQVPPLDGMMFINDDGAGVPRLEQRCYDTSPCRDGAAPPRSVPGPRPQGWNEALKRIGERAAALIVGGLPEC